MVLNFVRMNEYKAKELFPLLTIVIKVEIGHSHDNHIHLMLSYSKKKENSKRTDIAVRRFIGHSPEVAILNISKYLIVENVNYVF